MRILLVHNSYQQFGGEDAVVQQEKSLLERAGHRVKLYQRSNDEILRYSAFGRLALPAHTLWSTESRRKIGLLIKQHRPQVIHVHNTFLLISPSVYSVCKEHGIPVVQTLHNYRLLCPAATFLRDGHVCEECVERSLLRSVQHGCYHGRRLDTALTALMLAVHRSRGTWTDEITAYIALSEFVRRKFVNSGFTNDRIFIKPNFVYPDPGPGTRRDRGRAAGYALFVGRLSVEKGVDTLLAAWQRIHAEIPLLIIGDGPERMKLEARAASLGVYNVRFSGFLARTEILAAMKGASFLVFPSIWYENFPMTIAEAFACGTPIICSHLGAIAEIVEEGRTGLHFTPGNSKDLEEKAAWALSHPEQMLSMGAEARKEYEEKYTAEKNYRILMSIYERAQAGCSAASLCQSL